MFVSLTRLRLRSWFFLVRFLRLSSASIRQAVAAPGFRCGATLIDRGLVFWTCTVWDSEQAMRAYRGSGAHRDAMPFLRGWCSEAATTHWVQESGERPAWADAHRRLVESPRWQTLDHAGPRHLAREIPAPSTAAWRDQPMR